MSDTFLTLTSPSAETLYKEKGSKFYGYAFPVEDEATVRDVLEMLRKQHRGAVHFCYAWQLGKRDRRTRANDDGEPANSAGMPILGQILHYRLTDTLVVVVRYFGGVKLGVGGLMSAYKIAAQQALALSPIEERLVEVRFLLHFDYKDINRVMRIIREQNYRIIRQIMELNCTIEIAVRLRHSNEVATRFDSVYECRVESLED